ncbi:MAG: hypothetical protein IT233_04520, partial [Bacteroidia bacterium]|nr:hypothetical protein [Bacteroidia bacterium]
YEKLKTLYKDSFKRDLEADLLPPLPTGLPSWVSEIKTVEDYLARVPVSSRQAVIDAFMSGTIELKVFSEDILLIRHINQDGFLKSYWYADKILCPNCARKELALPVSNSASYISKVRIRKGTPLLYGKVASQVSTNGFGLYATGGGEQYYFLKEFYVDDNIMKVIEGPIPNSIQN